MVERGFYQHGINRAPRKSAAIATVSEASRQAMLAYRPELEGRVQVTFPGVGPEFRRVPVSSQDLARFGLRPDRRFVLTVGQYSPYKNHEGALAIFAHAFAERDDIDMVFIQRLNRHSDRLKALAAELGVADRVHFLAQVDDEDLARFYSAASALLHPSLCEGFGLSLNEAMACGCPVLTSNRSAMPEVVGDAALVADPQDVPAMATALRRVVDTPDLAASMAQRGNERAAEMRWIDFAAANAEIYRTVLGR